MYMYFIQGGRRAFAHLWKLFHYHNVPTCTSFPPYFVALDPVMPPLDKILNEHNTSIHIHVHVQCTGVCVHNMMVGQARQWLKSVSLKGSTMSYKLWFIDLITSIYTCTCTHVHVCGKWLCLYRVLHVHCTLYIVQVHVFLSVVIWIHPFQWKVHVGTCSYCISYFVWTGTGAAALAHY